MRIAAVRTLEALGYSYCKGEWRVPATGTPPPATAEVDATHSKLMQQVVAIAGCMEVSAEAGELKAIVDLIEACEAKWGRLKEPGGKG
jgi:hypothetical protein